MFQIPRRNSKYFTLSFYKDQRERRNYSLQRQYRNGSGQRTFDATFPDFVKVGNSYIRKTVFREYKPVSRPDENVHYILFKTSFGSIKIRFNNEEDLKKELASMDQLFDVE